MKKSFFDKEVIVKRGSKANSFLVILKGKALVLNSLGNEVFGVIQENQSFGLIEILKSWLSKEKTLGKSINVNDLR